MALDQARWNIGICLGWLTLAVFVVVGAPLFLCMPLWADVTLYDLAARNLLQGGVHYRDIFDTNLPGMVWLQLGCRTLFGWSSPALRAVDLAVMTIIAGLLWGWLRGVGVSRTNRVWFLAALAGFYLFQSEFCHVQRDVWMMMPALVALNLRWRGIENPARHPAWTITEGILWGIAFWIKPHIIVPALAVWLTSLGFREQKGGSARSVSFGAGTDPPNPPLGKGGIGRSVPKPTRTPKLPFQHSYPDTVLLILGGLLAALPGVVWLIGSGTWPHFWEVMTNWNSTYYEWSWSELDKRSNNLLMYFSPWSLVHLVAIPAAILAFRRGPREALLAALYLGWFLQAFLLQKRFDYVHLPPVILGMAVLTARGWPIGQIFIGWCVASAVILELGENGSLLQRFHRRFPNTFKQVLPAHPLADGERMAQWPRCVAEGATPRVMTAAGFESRDSAGTDWEELTQVAEFLRSRDVRDGELICWHNSTHPLYLMLDVKPAIRYMHTQTALLIPGHHDEIARDVRQSGHRYVVSDLLWTMWGFWPEDEEHGERSLTLPRDFSDEMRAVYPWSEPMIFRCGRYVVHRVEEPLGEIVAEP